VGLSCWGCAPEPGDEGTDWATGGAAAGSETGSTEEGTSDPATPDDDDDGPAVPLDAGAGPPPDPSTITGRCHEPDPPGAVVPPPVPTYSGGVCPAIAPGYVTGFLSQGRAREFALVVPSNYDPEGTYPLVFMWYHLSGDAMEFVAQIGAQTLADTAQAIFVVPQATGDFEFVWPSTPLDNGQAAVDLGFFDDLLACVSAQYAANPSCVASAGVSAGGLWTAFLGQRRGQYLASNLVISGGYPQEFAGTWWGWQPSPHRFASAVIWGGPTDKLGIDFHAASLNYLDHVRGDGHFVMTCEHTGGHGLPPLDDDGAGDPITAIVEFVVDHPYWQDGTSWLEDEGIPAHWPSYCSL
jgi:hypothetical protein